MAELLLQLLAQRLLVDLLCLILFLISLSISRIGGRLRNLRAWGGVLLLGRPRVAAKRSSVVLRLCGEGRGRKRAQNTGHTQASQKYCCKMSRAHKNSRFLGESLAS